MDVNDGRSQHGFDTVKHDAYVAKGYCHAVHWTKAYCYLPHGHAGKHKGIYLLEDGSMRVYPEWD